MQSDPDNPSPAIIDEVTSMYEQSAKRLKAIVLHPPGASAAAQTFNQARAAQQLAQVRTEIATLKGRASKWTGKAITTAMNQGLAAGDEQARNAGVAPTNEVNQGSFTLINKEAIHVLAQNTVGDFFKAANSMEATANLTIHRMSALGVSTQDVNRILAGGIIEGKPAAAIHQLRDSLQKVHGETVEIAMKNGGFRTYDTDYYAQLVANTNMRRVTVQARHERLSANGLDLVQVEGSISLNPCTLLRGHVFSLSGHSTQFPAFSTVAAGQLPWRLFHPNCGKFTIPFIEGLSKAAAQTRSEAA